MRCKQCQGFHHTLLHKAHHKTSISRPTKGVSSPRCNQHPTGVTLLGPLNGAVHLPTINGSILLPTIRAQIEMPNKVPQDVRCLMNTDMMHSTLQRAIAAEDGYFTYILDEIEWCPLRIVSAYDSSIGCDTPSGSDL